MMVTGDSASIEQLVEEFLTEELGFAPGEVVATARFADDFGVDSLDLLELGVDAQERFGAEISDEALATVVTVADFGRCVVEAIERREPRFHTT
jgi:acyl carrier protein